MDASSRGQRFVIGRPVRANRWPRPGREGSGRLYIGSKGGVLQPIRAVFEGDPIGGPSDGRLLERFVAGAGDKVAASAFSALVERHGPMVHRVCLAALRDEHEAHDAAQAVFLLLASKARTLWVRDSIGPWLHGVALRIATRARIAAARRRRLERDKAKSASAVSMDEPIVDAVALVIHEEVGRLPDQYRAPLILCDLEGLTHQQAAGRLGWPVGTVKSRQSRGRERLRSRLIRRGLAPSAALAALASTAGPASAAATFSEPLISAALREAARAAGRSWLARAATIALAVVAVAACLIGASLDKANDSPPPRGAAIAPISAEQDLGRPLLIGLAADAAHDAEAIRLCLGTEARGEPPPGYAWLPWRDHARHEEEGLILRDPGSTRDGPASGKLLLVRTSPADVTERDVRTVLTDSPYAGATHPLRPLSFPFSDEGSRRWSGLVGHRLREDGGATTSRIFVSVAGELIATPVIRPDVRDILVIQPRPGDPGFVPPGQGPILTREQYDLLTRAIAANARPIPDLSPLTDDDLRRAFGAEYPYLVAADRISLYEERTNGPLVVDRPGIVRTFLAQLRPVALWEGRGRPSSSLTLTRGDRLIATFRGYDSGEWDFRGERGWITFRPTSDPRRMFPAASKAGPLPR